MSLLCKSLDAGFNREWIVGYPFVEVDDESLHHQQVRFRNTDKKVSRKNNIKIPNNKHEHMFTH